jgi:hypothetical protein
MASEDAATKAAKQTPIRKNRMASKTTSTRGAGDTSAQPHFTSAIAKITHKARARRSPQRVR